MSGFMSVQSDNLELDTQDNDPASAATQDQDPNVSKESGQSDATDWKKRFSDQQKYVTQLKQSNSALKDEVEKLKKTPIELPQTQEQLDSFKASHPELANAIITIARLEAQSRDKELSEQLKSVDNKISELTGKEKMAVVLKVHPDAKKIKESDEFASWYNAQSEFTQRLFESHDPNDWVRGISIYKSDSGIKSKSDKKIENAQAPTSGKQSVSADTSPKIWKASEVSKLSEQEYLRYRADIFKAKAEGRYINDISQL